MIRLFTDTSANLPEELIAAYRITVLPFSYTVNGETVIYPEEKDFDGKIFYQAMRNGADIRTSMVNMTQFTEAFEPCLKAGDSVLYIGMSGGISGTAAAAKMAVEELQEAYPSADIAAIDEIAGCGVSVFASAHGCNTEEMRSRKLYASVFQEGLFPNILTVTERQGSRSYRLERI